MAKHTPGPWLVDHEAPHAVVTEHHFPQLVAITKYGADGSNAANAQLISAAPDLAAAVHNLVRVFDSEYGSTASTKAITAARAALAKAGL